MTVRTELIPRTHDYDFHLGRHIEHDERSRAYDVAGTWITKFEAWVAARPRSSTSVLWTRHSPILDQGQLGSCTGNAITGLLGCEPFCHSADEGSRFNEAFAVDLYSQATQVDSFPGEYPPVDTGSSGLAVAKVAKRAGLISKYRHAFTTSALIYALKHGPVIVGVPWYESMFTPGGDGLVNISGSIVDGHEFLIRGYVGGVFIADNSWGTSWGNNGSFKFSVSTWNVLRSHGADVTVPQR